MDLVARKNYLPSLYHQKPIRAKSSRPPFTGCGLSDDLNFFVFFVFFSEILRTDTPGGVRQPLLDFICMFMIQINQRGSLLGIIL